MTKNPHNIYSMPRKVLKKGMNKMENRNNKNNMKEKVIETIEKYKLIESGDRIVLGISGGPDSMAMLDILNEIVKDNSKICQKGTSPMAIVVAHVNHMIREEAKVDEQYVKEYCKKNKIEFYSKSIDVQKLANNNKIGTEEAGRKVRYEFFDEVMKKTNSNKIAIAHNKNDKIETIIMHALRGSGIKGLIGIEPKREIYIRPLIECERNEIEMYCEEKRLNPRIDKTNFENIYTRNKIRNIVIPYIQKEFNPNIIQTIDRLSQLISEEEKYMEKQVEKIYEDVLIEEKEREIVLNLKEFNKQERVIKSRIIRYTITKIFGTSNQIELIHINDIIKLCSNNIGNKYLTPNKNIKVLIQNQKIYFKKQI